MKAPQELPPAEPLAENLTAPPQRYGLTVAEFCVRYRASRSGYAKAQRAGHGPEELNIFGKRIITPQAEAAWLEQQRQRSRELAADRFGGAPTGAPRPPARSSGGKRLGRPPAGGWPADPPLRAQKKLGRPTRAMVAARSANLAG
ncbi:hypothetical protein QTH97_22795 [Variovorax sp. J22R24]|uniref:hypothetical protein n=1 Tax=Variovorax gracilis TaxID=3053502 RepID=UPI0025757F67|nr:hypothetical protein [Variovorax sp. J22R24]MDM0107792.1 hypothetical protein [Variovorax sp. J22R24]